MTEPIQLQNRHTYFARECSLSRHNPLHMIKIKSISKDKVYYSDQFHGDRQRSVRHSFFKSSLFNYKGLFLIEDLGENEVKVKVSPVIEKPVSPDVVLQMPKKSFGQFFIDILVYKPDMKIIDDDIQMFDDPETACKKIWIKCCKHCGLDPESSQTLRTRKSYKGKPFLMNRQVAQYLMKQHTTATLKQIGIWTGFHHHSTIINSMKAVRDYIDTHNKFATEMIARIREQISTHLLM